VWAGDNENLLDTEPVNRQLYDYRQADEEIRSSIAVEPKFFGWLRRNKFATG